MAVELTETIQAVQKRQEATESRLAELTVALKAIEARLAELSKPVAAPVTSSAAKEAVSSEKNEVTPETLVMIAAAVTAFLGKKVRIRSARLVRPASGGANSWSLQGRVAVHASHHPRLRG